MGELNERLIAELVDAVRAQLRKEQSDRVRDVYLIGDIEKDTARATIERLRELAARKLPEITALIARTEIVRGWLESAARCECPSLDQCPLFDEPDLPEKNPNARPR